MTIAALYHVPAANTGGVSYNHGRGFNFSLCALRMDMVRNPHVQILGMPLPGYVHLAYWIMMGYRKYTSTMNKN